MIEQAGLSDNVMGCVVGQEHDAGKALIYFATRSSGQMCVEHFGGCCWDQGGTRVTATLVDEPAGQPNKAGQYYENGIGKMSGGGKTRKSRPKVQNMPYMMAVPQQLPPTAVPMSPVSPQYDSYSF